MTGKQTVWDVEWAELLGSVGNKTRMIATLCERHTRLVESAFPSACANGRYEGHCEYCEKEC